MSEIRSGMDGCDGKNAAQKFEHLSKKSKDMLEEELAELIDSTTDEDCDLELIDAYIDALNEIDPVDLGVDDPAASYADFKKQHPFYFSQAPQPVEVQRKSQRFGKHPAVARKLIAAILVVVLGSSMIAQATGFDIWNTIVRWTGSVFHFGTSRDNEPAADGFSSLQESLDAYMIEGSFNIKTLDGYTEGRVSVNDGLDFTKIWVPYTGAEGEYLYTIRQFHTAEEADQFLFETKQGEDYTTYPVGDIIHYIMPNNLTMTIMWRSNTTVGVISGELSEEEVNKLIDSIYER